MIKLSNGDLWVTASTPLDSATKSKLEDLGGRVKYIVGLDAVHNLYLRECILVIVLITEIHYLLQLNSRQLILMRNSLESLSIYLNPTSRDLSLTEV